ncbi:YlxM family DNA-binding protein [Atopobacter phocae]|uniref:YlxM family DNA-binding protein n=1 Tax=Atopobacter phocae TaxID=136492 RepID=UPI000471D0C3|nr:YlxM family DNA-binding protein [Atopobacter phocae]
MVKKTAQMNRLLDMYGSLLTKKQHIYMSEYYYDDFALHEIAENNQVSRQAVYDQIRRTERVLLDYEDRLKMGEQFKERVQLIKQMKEHVQTHYAEDTLLLTLINQLDDLNE